MGSTPALLSQLEYLPQSPVGDSDSETGFGAEPVGHHWTAVDRGVPHTGLHRIGFKEEGDRVFLLSRRHFDRDNIQGIASSMYDVSNQIVALHTVPIVSAVVPSSANSIQFERRR